MKTKLLVLPLILILFVFTSNLTAQDMKFYKEKWEQIDSLDKKGLPKSALEVVEDIYDRAKSEKNSEQVLKSFIFMILAAVLSIAVTPASWAETGSDGESGIVDELMLSRLEAGPPHTEVRGPALFNASRLNESFSRSSQPYIGKEESGRWSFRRYLR